MIVATIQVSGVNATTISSQTIPAGIIGARVALNYTDPMWDGLSKTVVLKGCATKDVVGAGEFVVIPAEVVAKPGVRVMVGIYGVDAENNIAIPTLWASIGVVELATDPAGDESTDGTLPVWAQIERRVAKLEQKPDSGGNVDFRTDETLTLKDGILSVNTTNDMEQDNTLPITSAGVFATVGNIEALLKTI